MDVPRAPGAPRPLTSSPSRPLFRPLQRPDGAPPPSTSVLSYGFYGLPALPPQSAATCASGRRATDFVNQSLAPPTESSPAQQQQQQQQLRQWTNSVSGPSSAFSPRTPSLQPRSAAGSGLRPDHSASPAAAPPRTPWEKGPSAAAAAGATWERRPPPAPTTSSKAPSPSARKQQQQQQQEQKAEPPRTPAASRSSRYPPPMRLLSGTVERVLSWLHLSENHSLLFEVFGTVTALTGHDPWVLRLRDCAAGGPSLDAVFYGPDRPLPPLRPGQAARCVGRPLGRGCIQAFSARAASPAEMALAQRLGFVCQRAVRDLTAPAPAPDPAPDAGAADAQDARATVVRRR